MMQRNTNPADALRGAFVALQDGAFATARDLAASWRDHPGGRLLHALGTAGAGDVDGGAAALAAIARANPASRHPVHDLADLLDRHGADPVPHLRAALAHRPDDAALLTALGTALAVRGPMNAAVAAFEGAARHRPDAASWSNLGKAHAAALQFDAAHAALDRAAALAPTDAQIGLNRAVARLKSGRMEDGWPLFRARHALPGRAPPPPGRELRSLDGVTGQTVLLLHDEGFGDTLQFIRYARPLRDLGARVRVRAPAPLARLLAGNGFDLSDGPYDRWCRIPDLPGVFATTAATIPARLPYLAADPALAARWHARLPAGRRVGLVWAGAPRSSDPAAAATDRLRSIPATRLAPLLDGVPGVTWISLQHGRTPPAGLLDPMPAVQDFADTAAIVATLDTVVSVDTAVAHLAAAMGRPVILLDRFDNCWRWMSERTDSPWYPGVLHIVRQHAPGEWHGVLQRAAALVQDAA